MTGFVKGRDLSFAPVARFDSEAVVREQAVDQDKDQQR
jgi:hypothetical protein